MEQFVWAVGAFIVAIGLVVTFHEFGHFWVARRCGVQVVRFSIGFGKPLWSYQAKDGTTYQVAMIPLGGYVRMLDHRVDEVSAEQRHLSFSAKTVKQRMAIVVAGPVANFIFALVALWLMLMLGQQAVKPIIGNVTADSIAADAGLRQGMEIVAVDGRTTRDWQAVNLALVGKIGDRQTQLEVITEQGQREQHRLDLNNWRFDPDKEATITSLGLQTFQPQVDPVIAQVSPNSPAAEAELQVGDRILGFDGTYPMNWEQILGFIAARPNQQVTMLFERNGVEQEQRIQLGANQDNGFLGIVPTAEPYPESYLFRLQYGPLAAVPESFDRTWQLMTLSVGMIKKLITGDLSVKNLSSPIGIAVGAGNHASYGLVYFLSFLALISVSLGILNLLPIPVLDGGHLVYYIIEWVRGKPVPEYIQEIGFRVGMLLLFMLMAVAVFNDIARFTP